MLSEQRKQLRDNGHCVVWRQIHWWIYRPDSGVAFRSSAANKPNVDRPHPLYALHFVEDLPGDVRDDLEATARLCYCEQLVDSICDFCSGTRSALVEAQNGGAGC